ncbi:MAG: choice-of-anchor Q domain-containing protein, partial [Prochloraceae cyanobacterium]
KGAGIDSKFGGLVNLSNSIVAANFNNQDIDPNSGFYIRSNGHNLIGNADPLFFFTNGVNGDLLGTALNPLDPLLGTFENRGGSRPTFNLLAGSPALDAGNLSLLPNDDFDLDFDGILNEPIPTDARGLGFDRVFNNLLDLGAVEFQPDPLLNPTPIASAPTLLV